MKKFLKDKKGVTILEGLISLVLLALVATGTFAVLLSASRKSSQPDIREEMALAVEKAAQKLQVYVYPSDVDLDEDVEDNISGGLCPGEDATAPLARGSHSIQCLLPVICDRKESDFFYTVEELTQGLPKGTSALRTADRMQGKDADGNNTGASVNGQYARSVTFEITCNGFTL